MLDARIPRDSLRLLLVDGDPSHADEVRHLLSNLEPDVHVTTASSLRRGLDALASRATQCTLTEVQLPDATGIRIVRALRDAAPTLPLIVLTSVASVELAVSALQHGAVDYVVKGPDGAARLPAVVREAVGHSVLSGLDDTDPGPMSRAHPDTDDFVATTPHMRRILGLVDRAASSTVPVLLEGETGTGKELLARAIHDRGPRRGTPFLVQNCAALADSLLESELFGHVRGAFTGAERDRRGLFDEAADGTVFLDEIGDAPLSVQAKLLRVIQHAEVKPVGADRPHRVRARIVAATNRRLGDEVRTGRFREDLFFRISAFPIQVPPLRHRTADIVPLVERTLQRVEVEEGRCLGGVGPETMRVLQRYPWPGNVRELEHEIRRLVLTLPAGERIRPQHVARHIRRCNAWGPDAPLSETMARVELAVIQDRLRRFPSKTAAAKSLGITREALYAKLRRLGNVLMHQEALDAPAVESPPFVA